MAIHIFNFVFLISLNDQAGLLIGEKAGEFDGLRWIVKDVSSEHCWEKSYLFGSSMGHRDNIKGLKA